MRALTLRHCRSGSAMVMPTRPASKKWRKLSSLRCRASSARLRSSVLLMNPCQSTLPSGCASGTARPWCHCRRPSARCTRYSHSQGPSVRSDASIVARTCGRSSACTRANTGAASSRTASGAHVEDRPAARPWPPACSCARPARPGTGRRHPAPGRPGDAGDAHRARSADGPAAAGPGRPGAAAGHRRRTPPAGPPPRRPPAAAHTRRAGAACGASRACRACATASAGGVPAGQPRPWHSGAGCSSHTRACATPAPPAARASTSATKAARSSVDAEGRADIGVPSMPGRIR